MSITVRQLLCHTSGIPNPIPLRWVHLVEEEKGFDDRAALARVLQDNANLAFVPGRKFLHSNIGYWLLGEVVRQVAAQSYRDYVKTHVLLPLDLLPEQMGLVIPNEDRETHRSPKPTLSLGIPTESSA